MNLSIGITNHSTSWEQWCIQAGIPFSVIGPGDGNVEEYALIVVTALPDREQSNILEHYLRGGGAILSYAPLAAGFARSGCRYEEIDYLLAGGPLRDVGLLDLECQGAIPIEANALTTSDGSPAMFIGPLLGGHCALIPFDLPHVLQDVRAETRQFPTERERLPFERVSTVAKGEALHIIELSVEMLFAARNIPLVRTARYPDGAESVVAFRVDSDGGSRDQVEDLHALAHRHEIPVSWFLDVKSHESWIDAFTTLEADEIGVHCYDHAVFPGYDQNILNVRKAIAVLAGAGITAEGFAAPLGAWNENLAAAIDDCGFVYSSEFSYMYDGLPINPETQARVFTALQIPIHPICTGSLKRVGYAESQMVRYFEGVVRHKLHRREPLLFYHHPRDKFPDAIDGLLGILQGHGPHMTLGELVRWWNLRSAFTFTATTVQNTGVDIRTNDRTGSIRLEIVRPDGSRAMTTVDRHIDLDTCRWQSPDRYVLSAEQLRRARTFDLRTAVADIVTNVTKWTR